LLVEDVFLVQQRCTSVTVLFDDTAVADYFDAQIDQGRQPEEFGRIWIHTHPGNSPAPSCTDEDTFDRCFGGADWAVMFILACGGRTYARLRFGAGPGGQVALPVEIDFSRPFPAAAPAAWEEAYRQCVKLEAPEPCQPLGSLGDLPRHDSPFLAEPELEFSQFSWPPEFYYDERFY